MAIVEFEDLECGFCARYAPAVRAAAVKYNVPYVHHDFIIPYHAWSQTAAVEARYLQDRVSPGAAEEYRRDVFANQQRIASKDDLSQFTLRWYQAHGRKPPFVIDPNCAKEVAADCVLGQRLGVAHTPTIVVVTQQRWIEVTDPSQLDAALDRADGEANAPLPKARVGARR